MQTIAAGSSMESELIAASSTADKSVWFCRISKFLFSRKVPRIHHDPGRSFETAIQLHLQDVELADSRASPNLG